MGDFGELIGAKRVEYVEFDPRKDNSNFFSTLLRGGDWNYVITDNLDPLDRRTLSELHHMLKAASDKGIKIININITSGGLHV
jgi:type II secretory pathway component PulC